MAVWKIDIEKQLGTEFWTNVYHVEQSGQLAAASAGQLIANQEQNLHHPAVTVTRMRVSLAGEGNEGTIYPLNLPGEGNDGQYLPLFNVLRVDFGVASGRPSRKYYRLPVVETVVENGSFTTAYLSAIQVYLDALLAPVNQINLCDVDGQVIVSAAPFRPVGMRQLRRGSRRRTQPVLG